MMLSFQPKDIQTMSLRFHSIRSEVASILDDPTSVFAIVTIETSFCQLLISPISSISSLAYSSFNVSLLTYTMDLQFTLKSLIPTNSLSPYIYNRSFMHVKNR
ncbi:hypothetical protein Bca4012_032118 [Brassica carinata]